MLHALPPLIEPEVWTLAFHRTTPWWWVRLLAVGKYKHVSAFAWVAPYRLWVYYDITLFGTKLIILPDSEQATAWLTAQTADADLVRIKRGSYISGYIFRPFFCVSAVQHLIGLRSSALRPSALYAHVLAHGGEPIDGRAGTTDAVAGADCATAPGRG